MGIYWEGSQPLNSAPWDIPRTSGLVLETQQVALITCTKAVTPEQGVLLKTPKENHQPETCQDTLA